MLGGKRSERIGELVKEELGRLLVTKLKDPRLGFVTITSVRMTPDLREALVLYSVIGSDAVRESTQAALESARGFLQHELADLLKLRLTPRLRFKVDHSLEHSLRIESIIRKLHEESE
jgi:ribosome-binding factor A